MENGLFSSLISLFKMVIFHSKLLVITRGCQPCFMMKLILMFDPNFTPMHPGCWCFTLYQRQDMTQYAPVMAQNLPSYTGLGGLEHDFF